MLITELIEQRALFVCNHSGGKDSQAMYILLRELIPEDQLIVVHADLPEVKDHARRYVKHPFFTVWAGKHFGKWCFIEESFLLQVQGSALLI